MSPNKSLPHRRAVRRPPASGRKATYRLTARDVITSGEELAAYHRQFLPLFQRREQRDWSLLYLCGQLSNLERKTIEPIVLALIGPDPNAIRGMQQFIGQGEWDPAPVIEQAQSLVAAWLGEPDGVVIVDGSGFPKQGPHSVGVGWQYCGHLGKIANCQMGVFSAYATRRGYAFLDERLYVLADWFGDEYRDRWRACGIPDTLAFHTEPELALDMIAGLVRRAVVPFRWVACDEGYGKSPAFLQRIAALGKWYLAEVPSDTRVWVRTPAVELPGQGPMGRPRTQLRVKRTAPRPQEMRELQAQLPPSTWQRRIIKEGSKGPLLAEFACLRITPVRDGLPGPRSWAILRRTLGPQPEVKFYLSNAPATCPLSEFVRVSGLRWPVETAFEEGKGEVGMDHYETRTWRGWHHHMTHAILAHLFLIRLRLLFQKKSGAHHRPGTPIGGTGHRRRCRERARPSGDYQLSPTPKPCGLLLAPQASPCTARQTTLNPSLNRSLVVITEVS